MERIYNGVSTTITQAITETDTIITVANTDGFPVLPQFRIRIENELLLVTAVNLNRFTVQRGVEGTTATQHYANTSVQGITTAQALMNVRTDPVDQIYPLLRHSNRQGVTVRFDMSTLTDSRVFTLPNKSGILSTTDELTAHTTAIGTNVHGLKDMSLQSASEVGITGGNINGTVIGDEVAFSGTFSRVSIKPNNEEGTESKQVLGEQITGWVTPTGDSVKTGYNIEDATVQEVAANLAQLIKDLKTHGLIAD